MKFKPSNFYRELIKSDHVFHFLFHFKLYSSANFI